MDINAVYKMNEDTGQKILTLAKIVRPDTSYNSGDVAPEAILLAGSPNYIHNGDFRSSDGWYISPENSPKIQFDLIENFVPETYSPTYKKAIKFTILQDISDGEEISILENNKVFSAVCYKVISNTAYFIIYRKSSSEQITFKMKKVTARGRSLNTKLVTFNSGTFPILYNTYFLNYGSSAIFPMIGLKIVGPITSGTEFYVCSAGVYGSNLSLPDINMLNKEQDPSFLE